MIRQLVTTAAAAALVLGTAGVAGAAPASDKDNLNHRTDSDANGYPDSGQVVTGQQRFTYGDDATTCEYLMSYRGEFDNDAYQDSGWIKNIIHCTGEEAGHYNYLLVHESDPRYTGNPDWAIWNEWEYHVLTVSGEGNLVKVQRPITG